MSIRNDLLELQHLQYVYILDKDIQIETRHEKGAIVISIYPIDGELFTEKLFWGTDNSDAISNIKKKLGYEEG